MLLKETYSFVRIRKVLLKHPQVKNIELSYRIQYPKRNKKMIPTALSGIQLK